MQKALTYKYILIYLMLWSMLCTVLCYTVPSWTVSCCPVSCCTVSWCAVSCWTVSWCAVSSWEVSCFAVSSFAVLWCCSPYVFKAFKKEAFDKKSDSGDLVPSSARDVRSLIASDLFSRKKIEPFLVKASIWVSGILDQSRIQFQEMSPVEF